MVAVGCKGGATEDMDGPGQAPEALSAHDPCSSEEGVATGLAQDFDVVLLGAHQPPALPLGPLGL
eukprot:10303473-Lingulodinium_polyedra.AAC.1